MPRGRRSPFTPEQREYAAYIFSCTHKLYRAAYLAAGNTGHGSGRNAHLTWGVLNNVPLNHPTFEQWVAMNKPLTYVAPAPTLVITELPAPVAEEDAFWDCAAYLPVHVPDVLPPAPAKQFWIHSF